MQPCVAALCVSGFGASNIANLVEVGHHWYVIEQRLTIYGNPRFSVIVVF